MNTRIFSLQAHFSALPHLTPMQTAFRRVLSGLALTLVLVANPLAAHAQSYTEQILHTFNGSNGQDVGLPFWNLIESGGLLYGTAPEDFTNSNEGAVYSFDPSTNQIAIVYAFKGNALGDGGTPIGDLVILNGTLYGVTMVGGITGEPEGDGSGDGTIYSLDLATNTEHVLHKFTDENGDGAGPQGGLTAVTVNGTTVLYGTTYSGTIFCINPDGSGYQTIYQFTGTYTGTNGDGEAPSAGLTVVNGILYGTTKYGGNGHGTIFSVDPTTQQVNILYRFQGSATDNEDGPDLTMLNVNGILYGITFGGGIASTTAGEPSGDALFSFDPSSNTERTLYAFNPNDNSVAYGTIGYGV